MQNFSICENQFLPKITSSKVYLCRKMAKQEVLGAKKVDENRYKKRI